MKTIKYFVLALVMVVSVPLYGKTEIKWNAETHTLTIDGVDYEFAYVKGGRFMMGLAENGEIKPFARETPQHRVTVSSFYMGKLLVTQDIYKAIMGKDKSLTPGDRLPTHSKYCKDVEKFLAKLNKATKLKFRLPTEAEWEYAALGGRESKGYRYSGSNSIDEVAWYRWNSNGEIKPVGQKKPNELGLYDMTGNVWEWCSDYFAPYTDMDQINTQGGSTNSQHQRVLRGGAIINTPRACVVQAREFTSEAFTYNCVGFRLVLDEEE